LSELGNYVGSCLPAGRAIRPGPVWRKMIEILWPSGPPVWGFGVGLTIPPHENSIVSKLWQQEGHDPKMGCCTIEEVFILCYRIKFVMTIVVVVFLALQPIVVVFSQPGSRL